MLDAPLNYVLVHRQAERLLEQDLEVRDAKACDCGELGESESPIQMAVDVVDHALTLASRQTMATDPRIGRRMVP